MRHDDRSAPCRGATRTSAVRTGAPVRSGMGARPITALMAEIRGKVSAYLEQTGMAGEEFGKRALERPDFVERPGVQRSMTLNTADRLLRFRGEASIGPFFRREVEDFLEVTGTRAARFGIEDRGDSCLVKKLRTGGSARLTAVEQVRAWIHHIANPSQRAAISRMIEDSGRSTSIVAASPVMQGEGRRGKISPVSNADKATAEYSPVYHRRTFLSTSAAATFLSHGPRTLHRYRAAGVGSAYYRFHGRVVYTRADLLSWASAGRESTHESG